MKLGKGTWRAIRECRKQYWEGMDAYLQGYGVHKNPYLCGTKKWIAWRGGWLGAC